MERMKAGHAVIKRPKDSRAREKAITNFIGIFESLHAKKSRTEQDRHAEKARHSLIIVFLNRAVGHNDGHAAREQEKGVDECNVEIQLARRIPPAAASQAHDDI